MSRTTKTIKAVLFDAGGVLLSPPQTSISEVQRELHLSHGVLTQAFASGEPNNAFCRLERGELTLSQFFPLFEREVESVARSRGITLPSGFSASQLFQRIGSSVRPVPAMIRAVQIIKKAGFKVGVITNDWIDDTRSETNQFMNQFLNSHFDAVLQSSLLGIRKPNPLIYRLACHRLGIEPAEAVFLDDLGRNVKSAREVGMATVRVRETETALRELETLLGVRLVAVEEEDGSLVAKSEISKL